MTSQAIGIDVGGTGIKGALVDLATGELISERFKVDTPRHGTPGLIVAAVARIMDQLQLDKVDAPIGMTFPAVVKNGRTLSAANVSPEWIGLEAERMFELALGRELRFLNDADAAGLAEARYGAAQGVPGLVVMTTLGTGIGTALLYDGVLIPNSELGHLEIRGKDAEQRASNAARERERLSWEKWAKRLQEYYRTLERLLSPDLFVVGGGVSKEAESFLPLLQLSTPIVPGELRNNSGIVGAAALAGDIVRAPGS